MCSSISLIRKAYGMRKDLIDSIVSDALNLRELSVMSKSFDYLDSLQLRLFDVYYTGLVTTALSKTFKTAAFYRYGLENCMEVSLSELIDISDYGFLAHIPVKPIVVKYSDFELLIDPFNKRLITVVSAYSNGDISYFNIDTMDPFELDTLEYKAALNALFYEVENVY